MPVHETHLIGPPGTGKTTWLQQQVRRALERYSPAEILVMSFTRTAAANVAGRGTPLPRKNISTIHSFAYRLLGRPMIAEAKIKDFNLEQPAEWQLTAQRVDEDLEVGRADKRTRADALFEQVQTLRNNLVPTEQWPDDVLEWYVDVWKAWKDRNALADFTDLLEDCLDLSNELEWEVAPKVCFVDEAQDNSPLEMALVRRWSQVMNNLVLCGDPDQAIYSFKGANPKAMVTTTAPHNRVVLSQSYRVPRRIHAIARELICMISDREDAPYEPLDREGEVCWLTATSWASPEHAIEQACETTASGKTAMILTACSYQLEPTRKLLRSMAIPFHNPYRRKRTDWNPLVVGGRGMSATERLWRFCSQDASVHGPEARPWSWADVKAWAAPLAASAFLKRGARSALLEACEENLKAEAAAKDDELGEAVKPPLPMVDDFEAWFDEDAIDHLMTCNIEWYFSNLQNSHRARFKYPYEIAKAHGVQALGKQPSLIIGTIHSVKGGEADHVWLFPDISVSAHREAVVAGPSHNIRTFYVGVTRAIERLTMMPACEPYHMHALETMVRSAAQQQQGGQGA